MELRLVSCGPLPKNSTEIYLKLGALPKDIKKLKDSVIFLGWAVWKRRSFYLVCFGAEGFFEKHGCL